MTTFQAIIFAAINGICEFLPVDPEAHRILISLSIDWPMPSDALLVAFHIGSLLAVFFFFIHDWASLISSFLQVILLGRRPMTLDERLPFFLGITSIPLIFSNYYFRPSLLGIDWSLPYLAGITAGTGLLLWFSESLGRKTKSIYDWNWLDAMIVGIIQASAVLPGWDHLSAIFISALILNYRREAALKYAYLSGTAILLIECIDRCRSLNLHAEVPSADLSWLSFGVAIVVSCFVGFLTIGGFSKQVQQKKTHQYVIYRFLIALGFFLVYYLKNHGHL